ncbi:hypothetical protein phiBZS1_p47 [Serratia phage vB_SspM_BZS1]|nr:hypothetical protein phiBZS1_p47 [Serratia phage vB_SspM_BZS1]
MIKRFNPDFSLSISHELAYMRETPEGGYVTHGDYATLFSELELVKAERDALAVENAEMRGVIDAAVAVADNSAGITGWHLNGEIAGWDEILPELNIETQATDAAIAAIEARGVEKFGERMLTLANDPTYSTASHRNDLRDAGAKAKDYATELREAK